MSDALSDFIAAMELEGIRPVEPIAQRLASGELIRFRCEGDGRGRQNGWAILYLDERPAGSFGNYRLGVSRKWRMDCDLGLTAEEREAMQREWIIAKQRRLEERVRTEAEAAKDALDLWTSAEPASSDHPYLLRKQLYSKQLHQRGDRLLVPMFDATGNLWNLQRISPDGSKRFLRGARTEGLFTVIGSFSRRGETAAIGEGYATMQAVHTATGYPSIVAFSARNIPAVARLWNDARPDLNFIICADDDAHLEKNVGMEAARRAAEEIGARVAVPLGKAA